MRLLLVSCFDEDVAELIATRLKSTVKAGGKVSPFAVIRHYNNSPTLPLRPQLSPQLLKLDLQSQMLNHPFFDKPNYHANNVDFAAASKSIVGVAAVNRFSVQSVKEKLQGLGYDVCTSFVSLPESSGRHATYHNQQATPLATNQVFSLQIDAQDVASATARLAEKTLNHYRILLSNQELIDLAFNTSKSHREPLISEVLELRTTASAAIAASRVFESKDRAADKSKLIDDLMDLYFSHGVDSFSNLPQAVKSEVYESTVQKRLISVGDYRLLAHSGELRDNNLSTAIEQSEHLYSIIGNLDSVLTHTAFANLVTEAYSILNDKALNYDVPRTPVPASLRAAMKQYVISNGMPQGFSKEVCATAVGEIIGDIPEKFGPSEWQPHGVEKHLTMGMSA